MLPHWFKEYLSFHRAERIALLCLVVLLASLSGYNIYQRIYWRQDWNQLRVQYGAQILKFKQQTESIQASSEAPQPWLPKKAELFEFDPNTLDSAGWVRLGFSPKQSAAILKYRSAGAIFRKPEDVKKLFVVDEQKYTELAPFIRIEDIPRSQSTKSQYSNFQPKEKPTPTVISIELNAADTTELMKLKGIGPSYAKRIIKYRELLGGYRFKEQLLEVYGMDSTRYLAIKENLLVDTTFRERINVNTADFKTLLRHPYLNKNQVSAIINYRKQHGEFRSMEGLKKIHLINEDSYSKIAPYLKLK